ncbi:hypothetical protein AVEN_130447-1 [Araneus ventricosus]|uniref:Uncharacterized protein n=1 Tax=Araneus ventricosus TaxID=182803 RepID=A0A4Y1ZLE3_ARAVE|nr:hypothetical protein AVEN_130447-1 [Araneus ventricosus]
MEKSRKNVWKIEEIFFMDFRKDLKALIEYFREIEINRHNIDDLLEQFDEGLRWICEKNMKPKKQKRNLMQYGGIEGWRSKLSRRFQAQRHPDERLRRQIIFKKEQAEYKLMIKEAKIDCSKEFLDKIVQRNSHGVVKQIIKDKKNLKLEFNK